MAPSAARAALFVVLLAPWLPLSEAFAASPVYFVSATIECPYYIRADGEWDTAFRPDNRTFRACHGLHVVAKQPGTFGDSYCGEDYTAWDGSVNIRASTDCAGDLFLSVEASSLQNFQVGTHDFPWWRVPLDAWGAFLSGGLALPGEVYDFLVANKTFEWHSPSMVVQGGTGDRVRFGTLRIGDGGGHQATTAADVYPVVGLALQQLQASGHLPDEVTVTVNHPLVGTPTTIWNTILFKDATARDSMSYPGMLRALPHEVGHVTYNKYHSGQGHWLTDARFYPFNHAVCQPLDTLRFAWYEGFADFVQSYVYPAALQPQEQLEATEITRTDPYYHLLRGCYWDGYFGADARCKSAATGFNHEGNVQAMLDQIYYGPYRQTFDSAFDVAAPHLLGMRVRDPHRPGRGQLALVAAADGTTRAFSLPSIAEVFGWVEAAGSNSHTAREFLDGQITPWCNGASSVARYCSSATFQGELGFLDAAASTPDTCPVQGPAAETSGTPAGVNVQLRFLDAQSNPLSAIHFGAVAQGNAQQHAVTLFNSGSDAISVDSLQLGGDQTAFQLINPPPLPLQLSPNGSAQLTLSFTPALASSSANLRAASSVGEGLNLPGAVARLDLDGSGCTPGTCGCVDLATDYRNCGACGVVCLGACVAGQCAPVPVPTYSITEIPLAGATSIEVTGVNDAGQVAGTHYFPSQPSSRGFVWQAGSFTEIGERPDSVSTARRINGRGQVVGLSDSSYAYLWDVTGGLRLLKGTCPPAGGCSVPNVLRSLGWAINEAGDVGGGASGGANFGDHHAAIWPALQPLQPLYIGPDDVNRAMFGQNTVVRGLSNDGWACGANLHVDSGSAAPDYDQAFVWDGTQVTPLGSLGGPSGLSQCWDMNDSHIIVGDSGSGFTSGTAMVWQNGTMTALPGPVDSTAQAINEHGAIVGAVFRPTAYAALWWGGQAIDLNTRIDPASGWTLIRANDISEKGLIVGQGFRSGISGVHAYLLTPQ